MLFIDLYVCKQSMHAGYLYSAIAELDGADQGSLKKLDTLCTPANTDSLVMPLPQSQSQAEVTHLDEHVL